jgi:hypothetical protein
LALPVLPSSTMTGAGPGPDTRHDQRPPRLVAALDPADAPADLLPGWWRSRPNAARPASNRPGAASRRRKSGQRPGDMARGIGRDHGAAQLAGVKGGNLLVDGADLRAFRVGQDRQVDRAGQVILGEFRGGAGVDQHVEPGQRRIRQRCQTDVQLIDIDRGADRDLFVTGPSPPRCACAGSHSRPRGRSNPARSCRGCGSRCHCRARHKDTARARPAGSSGRPACRRPICRIARACA